MKDSNYTDNGGAQLAGNAFTRLMSGLHASRNTTGKELQTAAGHAFPTRLLTGALVITAAAVGWTCWNYPQLSPGRISSVASFGLLAACFVSWAGTARAVFRYHRSLLGDVNAARERENMVRER